MVTQEHIDTVLTESTLDVLDASVGIYWREPVEGQNVTDIDIARSQSRAFSWARDVVIPAETRVQPDRETRTRLSELYYQNRYLPLPMVQREHPFKERYLGIHICTIQGLLLFANESRTIAQRTGLVNQAINMACIITVHSRQDESINSIMKAYLARLFRCCFIYDFTLSAIEGGLALINDEGTAVYMFEAGDLGPEDEACSGQHMLHCVLGVVPLQRLGAAGQVFVQNVPHLYKPDATTENLESIHALAVQLGFTRLTITTTTSSGSDSAVDRPSQPSLPEESPRFIITNFEQISRGLIGGLMDLTVVFDQVLELPVFLLDLLGLSPTKDALVLKITDPSSTYTVGIHDNGVQLLELELVWLMSRGYSPRPSSTAIYSPSPSSPMPLFVTPGRNLDAFLDTYGPFIRILNTNDKFKSTCFDTLSKATLRQDVLVGFPLNSESSTVPNMLEGMGRVQVVIFQGELNMETWIAQVLESLTSSSPLIVLDRVEDFHRIAPGHDETSLGWLKFRQDIQALNAFHLEVIAELVKATNHDLETTVIQLVERSQEKQRVLSMNKSSSRDATMIKDLMVRQSGYAHLLVSYQTNVTMDQVQETQEKLYKRGIHWCLFTMSDL
ncbi:hypothetical protein KI688_010596 [Linnemannia hyalina]|uniref:Uncharacterized protein n=1 Tax=Linnemannia hyalina TaxID=64524 RepID=A0A9P7XW44_9FUNG|nr:hypothetical protein KI688_010596 [Linnemannia hyalina]